MLADRLCAGIIAAAEQLPRFEQPVLLVGADGDRIFPARLLRVGAGAIGAAPPPCGPTIERYGSAQPWPWDRF